MPSAFARIFLRPCSAGFRTKVSMVSWRNDHRHEPALYHRRLRPKQPMPTSNSSPSFASPFGLPVSQRTALVLLSYVTASWNRLYMVDKFRIRSILETLKAAERARALALTKGMKRQRGSPWISWPHGRSPQDVGRYDLIAELASQRSPGIAVRLIRLSRRQSAYLSARTATSFVP
jgi:hypothetical protein